jgi:CRP/FNR family transcriptional regulator, cyclic AMP receptor protein
VNIVERVSLLRRVELFAGAPGRVLAGVAEVAEEIAFDSGTVIIEQGDLGHNLYIVVEGELVAEIGTKTIATLGPGSVVGELAVFVPEPRSATVRATAAGRLLSIDKAAVDELLLDHPEVATSVITALVRRFQESNRLRSEAGY